MATRIRSATARERLSGGHGITVVRPSAISWQGWVRLCTSAPGPSGYTPSASGREAVAKLTAAGADAFGVALDVTDDASVAAAAQQLTDRAGRLDVLINNAGVADPWLDAPTAVTPAEVGRIVETNVIGVIRVINAMLPLLRRSAHPRGCWDDSAQGRALVSFFP